MTVREWFRKQRPAFLDMDGAIEMERIARIVTTRDGDGRPPSEDPMFEAELILHGLIDRLERKREGTYRDITRNTEIFWRNQDITL